MQYNILLTITILLYWKNIANSKKWSKNTNIGLALLISIITFLVYKAIGYNINCEIKNGNNDIESGNFIFLFLFNLLLLSKISILYFKYFFNKKFFLNQLIKLHTTIKLNMSWFFGNKNYCLSVSDFRFRSNPDLSKQ